MENLTIVKIGGGVLENQNEFKAFLDQFVSLTGKKMLVHGGGRLATKIMENLGIPVRMVDGRRITDKETLDVVTMVYGGLVNKKTVAALQSRSCNAIGLCGADAAVIISKKRMHSKIEYGFVGDIESIDHDQIIQFLVSGLVPVFSPITMDPDGQLLNTNADHIASALAVSLTCCYKVKLIYCFEKPGVLSNPEDDQSVMSEIDLDTYHSLKSSSNISNGMIPKLDNCYHALAKGVERVYITNGNSLSQNTGTKICL